MSDIAVRVEHLGKQYRIGRRAAPYKTLRESLVSAAGAPLRWLRGERITAANNFWALDDVSFEIRHGEAVGIIGRNGAGKSTLLKVLSRITKPTRGRVDLYGRVGSLLEVGTGFHPELTGRENIYLNGAILGMRRWEIERKFDEIVDFSGGEKFLDTAVKYYSSGMFVRLAFAVAAHLEPEILVVDEVLAVGDADFQKRCLGKMSDAAHSGRTVLFVSHNLAAIQNLCRTAILLESGKILEYGETSNTVGRYLSTGQEYNVFLSGYGERTGDHSAKIKSFEISPNPPQTGQPVEFVFNVCSAMTTRDKALQVELAVSILSEQYAPVFQLFSKHMGQEIVIAPGDNIVRVRVDSLPLVPGTYRVNLWVGMGNRVIDWITDALLLSVETGSLNGGAFVESRGYPVLVRSEWTQSTDPS